jgi:hypothetical protein
VSRIKDSFIIDSKFSDYQPNIILMDFQRAGVDTLWFAVNIGDSAVPPRTIPDPSQRVITAHLDYWVREGDDGSSHLFIDNNADGYLDYHVKFLGVTSIGSSFSFAPVEDKWFVP